MFHGLSPESIINSIRSAISLRSMHSQQHKEPRGEYDVRSKSGSFELEPEMPFKHKTGFGSHGSHDEDSIAAQV